MFDFSNLSHEEYYKINGNLTHKRIEDILDAQANLPTSRALDEVAGEIKESQVSIGEDVLSDILIDVEYLAKRCKGENRDVAIALAEKVRQLETELQQALEYHNDKIKSAIESVNNIQTIN